jgi:hypothetical protein
MQTISFIKNLTPKLFRKAAKPTDFLGNDSSKTLHERDFAPQKGMGQPNVSTQIARMCERCEKEFPKSTFHCCEIYGGSRCPECIPSHFCLTLNNQYSSVSAGTNKLITTLLLSRDPVFSASPLLRFHFDVTAKQFVLIGFSSLDVEKIRQALVKLRDYQWGFAADYGLSGMKVEYVSGLDPCSSLLTTLLTT